MQFCLSTLTKSLGLGQDALAARTILNDRKAIDLCLLKKACWLDLKHNPDHKTLYRTYRSWFKHQIIPVSYKNPAVIKLIENDLGGIIVELNQKYMDDVDHMNSKYHPYLADLTNVKTTFGMGLLQKTFQSGIVLTRNPSCSLSSIKLVIPLSFTGATSQVS